ncbi:methionine ABC transporter ATP-binding protein [Micrococcoides hystricis]|uniref:Methionine ABC transporter ATP-binding protein n=1 Tax=Micrococcoides hystricis TaxID=1572761 RepID=A0ABV6P944_9MICC
MIEIRSLRKTYRQKKRQVQALDNVDLRVGPGQIHGIIGRSGAGKSTLVRCLTLLDRPTSGTVSIAGKDMSSLSGKELLQARRKIGMVFQHANLFDSRTAAANVAYPLELVKTSRAQINAKVQELLDLVGLAEYADAYPAQLSGGQRQRVGIARALATDPDVLLCDEPTSALDPQTTYDVLDLIKSLRNRLRLTVVIITHEMHVVKYACDAVSLLRDGRIEESGSIHDVVRHTGSDLSHALLPLPATLPENLGPGPVLDLLYAGTHATEPVISGLTKRFGIDVNVLAGTVEELAGQQFAHLRIQLPPESDVSVIQNFLAAQQVTAQPAELVDPTEELES